MIIGIDEVGRGSWAGPLVIGAIVLDDRYNIIGLTDSKLLKRGQREILSDTIVNYSHFFACGWASNNLIDKIGLTLATRAAILSALNRLELNFKKDQIIIDGSVNYLKDTKYEQTTTTIVKADLTIPCVSAASILAKVSRDRYMLQVANIYNNYDFEHNVGYGTKKHIEALERFGVTPLHRVSYKSLKRLL